MDIESIKPWQWAVLGICVGLLFSVIQNGVGPSYDTQPRDTIESGEFENSALVDTSFDPTRGQQRDWIEKNHRNLPLLRDVTVHPPLASDPTHNWVTGRIYWIGAKPDDPKKIGSPLHLWEEWKPFRYQASIPYKPGYTELSEKKTSKKLPYYRTRALDQIKTALGGVAEFPTVSEYLKAAAAVKGSTLQSRYAWWELPKWLWSLPPVAGFLTIGVAWPLALGVMQNWGLAKAPKPKAKLKSAWKPQPMPKSEPAVLVKPVVTPPPPPDPDSRKYGGEFYPVVKSSGKE